MLGGYQPELMEYKAQNRWAMLVFTLLMLMLLSRFFYLQILAGEKYEKLAKINQISRVRIPAERGDVMDRNGAVLASNIHTKSVAIVPHYIQDLDYVLDSLSEVLELSHARVEELRKAYAEAIVDKVKRFKPITVSRSIISNHCPEDSGLLNPVDPRPYLWCPICGRHFSKTTASLDQCPYDTHALTKDESGVSACPHCNTAFVAGDTCPVDGAVLLPAMNNLKCSRCGGYYRDQAAVLMARLHQLPGVEMDDVILRGYPQSESVSHILGYMNQVNAEDIDTHPGVYRPGDTIGRMGIERALEEILRGRNGERIFVRSSAGTRNDLGELAGKFGNLRSEMPVPGNNAVLTLDLRVQKLLREALSEVNSGAAVVMDVRNGEILGIYSHPTFDSNIWSGRLTAEDKKKIDENPFNPMINKAVGAFPPASTFKIVTALAALNEGISDFDTVINCPGFYDFSDHRFGCYNRYGHGDLNLTQALVGSCDVYFYRLGEWLGIDRLERYARLFGLGERTGIEIGDNPGLVPSREWHDQHSKGGFRPGFTLSTAVGQKDIRATPVQMAMVVAEVANGGHSVKPHLLLRVEDRDGNVLRSFKPGDSKELGIPSTYLDFIREAMVGVVEDPEGTAYKSRLASIRYGGKTGTAEAREVKKGVSPAVAQWLLEDHAWFVGFVPAENPRYSVVIFIEHGGFGGSVATPLASRIIHRLVTRIQQEQEQEAKP